MGTDCVVEAVGRTRSKAEADRTDCKNIWEDVVLHRVLIIFSKQLLQKQYEVWDDVKQEK